MAGCPSQIATETIPAGSQGSQWVSHYIAMGATYHTNGLVWWSNYEANFNTWQLEVRGRHQKH